MVEGKRPPGRRVAVVDYEGYFTGTALAELLRGEGYEVEFVTRHEAVAPLADQTLEGLPVRRRLHELGIRRIARCVVERIAREGGIELVGEFGARSTLEVDARRAGHPARLRRRALPRAGRPTPTALEREGIEAVYRIGDCVAPRLIADAIFDGHRLAREIDSPDPARPLPYLRERPLV